MDQQQQRGNIPQKQNDRQTNPAEGEIVTDQQEQPTTRYTKTIQYAKIVTGAQPAQPPPQQRQQQQDNNIPQDQNDEQTKSVEEETTTDQQEQPTTRYTKTIQYAKTVTGAQPTQTKQQQYNIPQDRNKMSQTKEEHHEIQHAGQGRRQVSQNEGQDQGDRRDIKR